MWQTDLSTNPAAPKTMAGDSSAAYALFSFWGDPGIKYVLRGQYPHASFVSLETNETRWGLKEESLFDANLAADAGSSNPFQEGVPVAVQPRSFTVEIVPEGFSSSAPNVLHIRNGILQHSVLLRIYQPLDGRPVTKADLPRISAFDAASGAPAACPANAVVPMTLDLPQALTLPFLRHDSFDFQTVSVPWGPNSAIPDYLGGVDRMWPGDIALIRFRAPTYVDNRTGVFSSASADVRYWSLCSLNTVKLVTLDCLPDTQANPDTNGMVTVVFGRGESLRRAAQARGWAFLADTRGADQPVAQFVYRNILAAAAFVPYLYQGDFRPQGVLCSRADFLRGGCDF